ncbi:MAG TPA: PEP-CTERM sorting domain-containing protein [Roseiarcus sp.]
MTASSALAGVLAMMGVMAIPGSAHATLHGFCNTSDSGCVDNGTNTPTTLNPPDFGFSAGGHSATGDLMIDILVPDTIANPSTAYTISGPLVGVSTFTASLVKMTAWTSGALDSYLGISASPNNPIGAYLPSTKAFDPSATGFFVYSADLGTQTLPSNSGASNSDLLTLDKQLLQGSYVVAFLNSSNATANSGAIFETGRMTSTPEASTWAMMLLGFAGLGVAGYRKAQSGRIAPSVA